MRTTLSVSILAASILLTAGCEEPGSTLPWHTSLEAALEEAAANGSPVIAYVYTDWCGRCGRFEKDTISNAQVQLRLEEFTRLKLDADRHRELAQSYRVQGYPTVLVLDSTGKMLRRNDGYVSPRQFLDFLQ